MSWSPEIQGTLENRSIPSTLETVSKEEAWCQEAEGPMRFQNQSMRKT
jgi:hypothetical protein